MRFEIQLYPHTPRSTDVCAAFESEEIAFLFYADGHGIQYAEGARHKPVDREELAAVLFGAFGKAEG